MASVEIPLTSATNVTMETADAPVSMDVSTPIAAPDTAPTAPTAGAVSSEAAAPTATADAPAVAAPAAAAAAPVVPRTLPHPPEYYQIPSSTSNALLPRYSDDEMAALAALPAESSGYAPVLKHHLVNPFMKPKLPAASPPPAGSGLPSPSPEPAAAAAAGDEPDAPAAKRARATDGSAAAVPPAVAEHDANTAPSSSCAVHEHGARGDEFDAEEAAGAQEAVRDSEKADADAPMDLSPSAPTAAASPAADAAAAASDAQAGDARGDKRKADRKRARGQNKNADREFFNVKESIEGKICKVVAAGKECRFGDKCRHSHDMVAYKAALAAVAFPGPCPIFARYGACPTESSCKWGQGHLEQYRPSQPFEMPGESNTLPHELSRLLRNVTLDVNSAKYKAAFPRTAALTKSYEIWRRKAEQLRNRKQQEKEAAQRVQAAEAKAAAKAARDAGQSVPVAAPAAAPAVAAAPASTAAADSAAVPADASTTTATAPAPALSITAATLPPSFIPHSAEDELAIAALKASYVPAPATDALPFDPFGIVSEEYTDWSSGVLLIDLERRPFDFRNKLYLAPLTTVGNLPFRRLCRGFGADVTIGEMALCNSLGKGAANEWALLRRHESEKHFGVQIAGSHPDQVSRACELIAKTCQVDFVDLNIGCPIDQVTDKGMGSAMMQRKRMRNLEPIMRSMRTMLDCPATIKMRMGWSTQELTAMEILPIVNRCGLAAVTIHGRTRQQRYTKSANWDFIRQAASYAKEQLDGLQVIANGDVYSFEDYEAIVGGSDIATTMIARGALVKPWLFTEIKERRHWDISASERLDMLRDFVRFGHEHFGTDTKGVESTRRYLLEMLSFLHRYVPVGLLERPRVSIQQKNPPFYARSDLEQLLSSSDCKDWIRISEMLIGPVPDGFRFTPKHKSSTQSEESNG